MATSYTNGLRLRGTAGWVQGGAPMNTNFSARRRLTALAGAGALVLGTLGGTMAFVAGPVATASAAGLPSSATDQAKVPHYFGPWPNWANSPLTISTAQVSFVDPTGTGAGAETRTAAARSGRTARVRRAPPW